MFLSCQDDYRTQAYACLLLWPSKKRWIIEGASNQLINLYSQWQQEKSDTLMPSHPAESSAKGYD